MTSTTLFYIIISIIIINFIIEKILDFLNAQQYNDALPKEVSDVYNQKEYLKSQAYKKVNFKLSNITSLFSLITTLLFFILNGFEFVDQIARTLCTNNIIPRFPITKHLQLKKNSGLTNQPRNFFGWIKSKVGL